MAHPGFEFTRRSFHTLKNTACLRKAYLGQMLGVRRKPHPEGDDGPLMAGKVFHTMMEVHYTPPEARHLPLKGTDGNPVLPDIKCVVEHYCERGGAAAKAVCDALDAYGRYSRERGEDADLRSRLLGRPEPDVDGELADLLGHARLGPIPYSAQYDMIVRNSNDPKIKGVTTVEHKLLAGFYPNTVRGYLNSGQLIGQCAVWNSRQDLVRKFGPMTQALINLTFKTYNIDNPLYVHRELLYFPLDWQMRYAEAVGMATQRLEATMLEYEHGSQAPDLLWTQGGLVYGECVPFWGQCDFLDICQSGCVEPEFYQITEPGRERAARDGIVTVSRNTQTYTVGGEEA